MNFRGVLVLGFIVIAAFTFPIVAFAEKGGQAQNPEADKSKGVGKVKDYTPLPDKPEVQLPDKANKMAKKGKDLPEKALNKAKKAKELPSQASEMAKKAVQKVKKKNEPALKTAKNKSDKAKRSVNKTLPENKGTAVKVKLPKQVLNEEEIRSQNEESIDQRVEQQKNNSTEKINKQPVKDAKVEVVSGNKEQPVKAKAESKEKKNPFDNEKSHDVKVIPFSSNSNVPSAPSKDRTGNGNSSIGLLDKWLWKAGSNTYIKLINPFVSTRLEYRDQWVNAPPSPPPKETPFF
ncbi:hypothetical protein VBD025_04815 [Virgibacillus flavescens]|uniref:hypothetical protein n=1 Tax=Virgibacillus flavescens TaxID=1611422 RepID=UPI003D330552